MRLRQIEIFNAVYSTGSISAAARMLNVAQPTVSKILKHAEDTLGFNLFKRHKGRLIPTDEADILYKETTEVYKKINGLKKLSRNLKEATEGWIKLVVLPALGMELIPRAIKEYRDGRPDVHFEIRTHHYDILIASLFAREKDFGIAFNPPQQVGIAKIPLSEGEVVCIYSGNQLDHLPDQINLVDVKGYDFISIEESGPVGDLIGNALKAEDIRLKNVITAQTYYVARNLVSLGAGIAFVDHITATTCGIGNLKYKTLKHPLKYEVAALYLEDRPLSTLSLDFINFLKKGYLEG